jgi:hypothetical protein
VRGAARAALLASALAAQLAPARPAGAEGETAWGARLFVGVPFNLPTPVRIRQSGEPDLRFRGRFSTRPFEAPWYYGAGLFRRAGGHEWSAELVHHKVHLENPPPEVQAFSISHGYNFVLLGHGVEVSPGVWARVAAGAVVAHPESTVRGKELRQDGGPFGRGYHLAGPALAAGIEGRVPLGDRARLALSARLIGGYAAVPVADGSARVPNLALHATAGLDADVVRSR